MSEMNTRFDPVKSKMTGNLKTDYEAEAALARTPTRMGEGLSELLREVMDAGATLRYDEWGDFTFPEMHIVTKWDKAYARAEAALRGQS